MRRTYETDVACGFDLAARRFAAMARAGLAGRRSYAACWLARRITGAKGQKAAKLLDFLGMSQRQVILAVIVGVLLAAVLMWLAPDLIVR